MTDYSPSEFDTALSMLRWAEDAYGNAGLVYGYCEEHDWRGRKRNTVQVYNTAHEIKMNAVADAVAHLRKKH